MKLQVIKRNMDKQPFSPERDRLASYTVDTPQGATMAETNSVTMAKLIAAAPELLETLKMIHSCVVYNDGPEIHLGKDEIIKLSQALAKAE